MRKKTLSLLLAFVMLFSVFFATVSISASAAKVDQAATGYTIPGENLFAKKLAQLQVQYPNGSYFPGVYYENGMAKAWTCHAYALIMLREVFGINYYNDMFYNKMTYTMGTIYAGDMVRINYNSHSIFITKVTDEGYYFTDGNYDGANGVRWNGFYTKSQMANIFTYKVHVPGNTLMGTGSANPELTLPIPELVSAEPSSAGITLKWNKVPEAYQYRVYYKGDDITIWKVAGITSANMFTISDLKYNTEYTFTVRCLDVDGFLVSSYDKNGISAIYKLDEPILTELKAEPDKMTLKWEPVKNAGRYKVYYKTAELDTWQGVAAVDQTSYTFVSGTAGVAYTFTVRCISDSKAPISSYDKEGLTATYFTYATQLAVPSNLSAVLADRQNTVTVSWDAVDGAERYQVFTKRTGIDSSWKKLGVSTTNTFDHTNCENNLEYTYTVRCIDADGRYMSGYDKDGVAIHYYAIPDRQTLVKLDDSGNIRLSWNEVDGAEQYTIYSKTDEDADWKIFAESVTDTFYIVPDCVDGVTYTYTVRTCDEEGEFLSSYDPLGVSLTYHSTYWPRFYSEFLNERTYLSDGMPKYYEETEINFALYDMDHDGSPELISNTGSAANGCGYYYVYTVSDGAVCYVGKIGEKSGELFYNDDSAYSGLFCQSGGSGIYYCNYWSLDQTHLSRTRVFELYEQTTNAAKNSIYKKSMKTDDNALYQAYLGAVDESTSYRLGRHLLHPLMFCSVQSIDSDGFDSFTDLYLYHQYHAE